MLAVGLGALYPVVFLWAGNITDQIALSDVLLVFGCTLGASLLVFGLLRLAFGDTVRAALLTLVLQLATFSFGHVAGLAGILIGADREMILMGAYAALILSAVILIRTVDPRRRGPLRVANLVLFVLVVTNVVTVARATRAQPDDLSTAKLAIEQAAFDPTASGPPRDVYYLIFDRYAGEQTLRDLYAFDDRPFLDGLRDQGFDVVDGALANYPQTTHSLASSLNMTYLDRLAADVGVDSGSWAPLYRSLNGSTVARIFQSMGYRYVHIGSWWGPTWSDPTADESPRLTAPPEFTGAFLETTAIPALARRLGVGSFRDLAELHADEAQFGLNAIAAVANDPRPTFTFAHVLLPHPPYVFTASGRFRRSGDLPPEHAYVEQLRYTNDEIDRLLEVLLGQPGPAPIIVLQSDEGPHPPDLDGGADLSLSWPRQSDEELDRKLRILEAYHLPGAPAPPPGITPVNSFRFILDAYFGGDLPLLDDRTYVFEDRDHPYRFEDVTERLR